MESAQALLADLLSGCSFQIQSSNLLALKRCLKTHDVAPVVVEAVVQFYTESGIDEQGEIAMILPLSLLLLQMAFLKQYTFTTLWSKLQTLAYGSQAQR